jgi:hypothetical protein
MKTKLALCIITLAGCFLCGNIFAAPPLPGAIFTTDGTCTGVNVNIYGSKADVYLNGGPSHPGAASLPDGSYYVRVTNPGGDVLLGTSVGSGNETPFVVSGGVANCIQLSAVLIKGSDATPGYDDTTNQGGEYKVWVSTVNTFDNNSTKTDNFKVKADPVVATLCIDKFYDANVDGIKDNGEVSINGWQFTIIADDNLINTRFTSPLCMVLEAGLYHLFEATPVETNWLHTTAATVDVTIPTVPPGQTQEFGNVCLGAGGGLTLGFWSNKNGQNLENANDFGFLTTLCLRTASGTNQDFNGNLTQNKSALHDWLLNANAVNMANMLSAQLAAMKLNVRHPGVTGTALVYGGDCVKAYQQSGQLPGSNGFITVNDLMAAANTELCAHPLAISGSPYRAFQECMKTTLDNANNNLNFVQGSPCPFSFAGVAP